MNGKEYMKELKDCRKKMHLLVDDCYNLSFLSLSFLVLSNRMGRTEPIAPVQSKKRRGKADDKRRICSCGRYVRIWQ